MLLRNCPFAREASSSIQFSTSLEDSKMGYLPHFQNTPTRRWAGVSELHSLRSTPLSSSHSLGVTFMSFWFRFVFLARHWFPSPQIGFDNNTHPLCFFIFFYYPLEHSSSSLLTTTVLCLFREASGNFAFVRFSSRFGFCESYSHESLVHSDFKAVAKHFELFFQHFPSCLTTFDSGFFFLFVPRTLFAGFSRGSYYLVALLLCFLTERFFGPLLNVS